MTDKLRIGMIGLGTVGTGVARILLSKHAEIAERTGVDCQIRKICVKHPAKKRSIKLGSIPIISNAREITQDPAIDLVIELIGGIEPAYSMIAEALKNGKDVVSANKALFCQKGTALYRLAQKHRCFIGVEASVCGGLPVFKVINEGLRANHIKEIAGILNGTCNYILTGMTQKRQEYAKALAEAQKFGYAEKDPSLDVRGVDTLHKLTILARAAFQREIDPKGIHCEGIAGIDAQDIAFAKKLGYRIKLLAIGRKSGSSIELRVHPVLLSEESPLANVHGVNNGLVIHGDETGPMILIGRGAGQNPTASAVVSDILDIAQMARDNLHLNQKALPHASLKPMSDISSRYYLRLDALNRAGVMAKLTELLSRQGISISSVHQDEADSSRWVPVVLLTHEAREKRLKKAVQAINQSRLTRRPAVIIRIEGA